METAIREHEMDTEWMATRSALTARGLPTALPLWACTVLWDTMLKNMLAFYTKGSAFSLVLRQQIAVDIQQPLGLITHYVTKKQGS
jgi:hypothetical protein